MKFVENKYHNLYYPHSYDIHSTSPKSCSAADIAEWIYRTELVEWWVTHLERKTIDDNNVMDKVQDIYEFILNVSQETWTRLYNEGKSIIVSYIVGMIKKQLISVSSKTYKDYEKYEKIFITQEEEYWNSI